MITVERTDFISISTRALENARTFYGARLGSRESTPPEHRYAEFETGNVTLAFSADAEFTPSPIAVSLPRPDGREARRELEAEGVPFDGEIIDTGVCHMTFCHDAGAGSAGGKAADAGPQNRVAFGAPGGHTIMLHRRYAS